MAKKVILKDQDNVEILPITRGELVIDSSGKEAFHSNEFLATDSQPGLMSSEDKYKLDHLEESGPGDNNKVAQINTTTNDVYRLLFSETADDTDRTEKSRKSANLTFNPSTGVLNLAGTINANGGTIKGDFSINDTTNTTMRYLRMWYYGSNRQNRGMFWVDDNDIHLSYYSPTDGINHELTIGRNGYKINNNTLIHSGNIGNQIVEGLFAGSTIGDANTVSFTDKALRWFSGIPSDTSNIPTYTGWQNGLIALPLHSNGITAQLYFSYSKKLYYRSSQTLAWNEIAYITDNVASATKLENTVKIWGQDFDGSSDVNGAIQFSIAGNTGLIKFLNGEFIDGYGNFHLGSNSASWNIYDDSQNYLLTILKSGNVGIGTTTPAYKLDVSGTIKASSHLITNARVKILDGQALEWNDTAANGSTSNLLLPRKSYGYRLDYYDGTAWHKLAYADDIPTVTNYYWADQLITSSAKSNTTPTFGNTIIKSGIDAGLSIHTSDAYSRIRFYNAANENKATIHYFATAYAGYTFAKDTLNIGGLTTIGSWNNPTMYITQNTSISDTSGKVGIGTTAPNAKLHVNGHTLINKRLTIGQDLGNWDASRAELELISPSGQANDLWLGSGQRDWSISSRSATENNTLNFYAHLPSSNTTPLVMTLEKSGNMYLQGNLYVGNNATRNFIAFRGTTGDDQTLYQNTFIGENHFGSTESSELILFKGNDVGTHATSLSTSGPDRIRYIAAAHLFQTYSEALQGTFSDICTSTVPTNILALNPTNIQSYVQVIAPSYSVNGNLLSGASSYTSSNPYTYTGTGNDSYKYVSSITCNLEAGCSYLVMCDSNYNWCGHDKQGETGYVSFWLRSNVDTSIHILCSTHQSSTKGCWGIVAPISGVYQVRFNTYKSGDTPQFYNMRIYKAPVPQTPNHVAGCTNATDSDMVDGYHASSFFKSYGTYGSGNSYDSDWGQSVVTFDPVVSGTAAESNPNVTILNLGNNYARRKQLWFNYSNNNIYYRRRVDSSWSGWVRLALASEIPTNTWRGITDSYSGTDSAISLSQKGANSLYNALVNGYASSAGSCTGNAKGLTSSGYGNGNLTYYQTDGSFFGNSGWSHYIIANHGNGSSYYNYTIALPFWDVPKYKRLEGGTADGWHTFITSENIGSQSVNYASSAGSVAWANVTGKPTIPTVSSRNLTVNGTAYTFYSNTTTAAASFYAPTSAGTSGYILQSSGGTPTWTSRQDYSYPGILWVGYIYRSSRTSTSYYASKSGGKATFSLTSTPNSSYEYLSGTLSGHTSIMAAFVQTQAVFSASTTTCYAYSSINFGKGQEAGFDTYRVSISGSTIYIRACRMTDANNSSWEDDGFLCTGSGHDDDARPVARLYLMIIGY